jgi:imidazolonepropionase-like amidohydrolase
MNRLHLIFRCALIVAAAPVLFAQSAPAPTGAIAVQHVTVINVETGGRTADQTVLVSGNRIAAVASAATLKSPPGARIVNARGKFVIPGLWEAHFHAIHVRFERSLPIAVARGITDARDMGAPISYLTKARKAIDEGLLTPRLFVAGPELDGASSPFIAQYFPPGEEDIVNTPEEGRRIVDQLAALKVDFIKVHNELKTDVYYAIADESKRKGFMFVGHIQPGVGILEASDAGQRTIEHLIGLQTVCAANPADLRRPAPNTPVPTDAIQIDQAKCEDAVRNLARNSTYFSPTPLGAPGQGPKRMRDFNLKIVSMAFKAGVPLLAGTDWPGPAYMKDNYSSFDKSPQDELAGFVEAGLTPLEALRTATLNPATLFKKTNELGSIQQGKLADLVVLEGDPLIDINNTKRVDTVIVNGRLVDSAERMNILSAEAARRNAATK